MSSAPTPTDLVWDIPEVTSGITTSWLPLVTPWPSSAGCESSFFLYQGQPGPAAWDPGFGYFAGGTPRCLPPAVTTVHEQDHQKPDGFTILSIRPIVCPAAFTTAGTSVVSGISTQVVCCPSGYALINGQPGRVVGDCQSPLTSGQIITYLASIDNVNKFSTSTITASGFMPAVALRGWNVAETTGSASKTGSSTSSQTGSSTSSTSTSTAECIPGLSAGAKGGIGVSAAIGAIGIIAFIAAVVLMRRRPKNAEGNYYDAVPPTPMYKESKQSVPMTPVHEIGTQRGAAELPSEGR